MAAPTIDKIQSPGKATFEAMGEGSRQATTFDEAIVGGMMQKAGFQASLFGASCFTVIGEVFMHRRFGERSFGLRLLIGFAVWTFGCFASVRDPEDLFALSWLGGVLWLAFIGVVAFHRLDLTRWKMQGKPHYNSKTGGMPSFPWAFIPGIRTWRKYTRVHWILLTYIEPGLLALCSMFAGRFIGRPLSVVLGVTAFAMLFYGRTKAYLYQQAELDRKDQEEEARQRLAQGQAIDEGLPYSVEDAHGFVVAAAAPLQLPEWARLGFLKKRGSAKASDLMTSTATATETAPAMVAPMVEPEATPPPIMAPVAPVEVFRVSGGSLAGTPPADPLQEELDSGLQGLVSSPRVSTQHVVENGDPPPVTRTGDHDDNDETVKGAVVFAADPDS